MIKITYSGYRFPPEITHLLAERGIMVSYKTVRRWVNHFGGDARMGQQ
jgi:putative transposase